MVTTCSTLDFGPRNGNKATLTTHESTEGFWNSFSKHECMSWINSSKQPFRKVKYRGTKALVRIWQNVLFWIKKAVENVHICLHWLISKSYQLVQRKFSSGIDILPSVYSKAEILPRAPTNNGAVQQEMASVNISYFAPHFSSFSIETQNDSRLSSDPNCTTYLACVGLDWIKKDCRFAVNFNE